MLFDARSANLLMVGMIFCCRRAIDPAAAQIRRVCRCIPCSMREQTCPIKIVQRSKQDIGSGCMGTTLGDGYRSDKMAQARVFARGRGGSPGRLGIPKSAAGADAT
eukprot:7391427-Prymnesium_polylepis.3